MQCTFNTYEKEDKNGANNLSLNELEFPTACVPWNYCPDQELFCTHQQHFCPLEEIKADCDAILTKTSVANSPTSYFLILKVQQKHFLVLFPKLLPFLLILLQQLQTHQN